MSVPGKRRALAQTTVASLFWGLSFPVIKWGLNMGLSPGVLVVYRFLIAAMLAWTILVLFETGREGWRDVLLKKHLWVLGFFNGAAFVLQYIGMVHTTAIKASLLINLNVVFVAIMEAVVLGTVMTRRVGAGVVFALLGVFLLSTEGDLSALRSGSVVGDIMELLAGFSWAFYIVYNKKTVETGDSGDFSIIAGTLIATFFVSLPYELFYIFISGGSGYGSVFSALYVTGFGAWAVILYTSVFGTVLAYLLWTNALRKIHAVVSSIFLLFEVVSASIVAYAFLGETLAPVGLLGAVLIGLAMFFVSTEI